MRTKFEVLTTMKNTEYWLWTIYSEGLQRLIRTSWRMTESEAKGLGPKAERVPGTCEVRGGVRTRNAQHEVSMPAQQPGDPSWRSP